MKCPACQAVLTEEVAACPECGFNYESLEETFGRYPTLKGSLSDMVRALPSRQAAKVRSHIRGFVRQFPQLAFNVLLASVPSSEPIAKYAFWIFNGAGICSHLHKGGLNFHTLLVIDVEHQRANLSVGYGLEPFISDDDLRRALTVAEAPLREKDYATAILAVLEKAREIFHERCEAIPQTYGLRRKPQSHEH